MRYLLHIPEDNVYAVIDDSERAVSEWVYTESNSIFNGSLMITPDMSDRLIQSLITKYSICCFEGSTSFEELKQKHPEEFV